MLRVPDGAPVRGERRAVTSAPAPQKEEGQIPEAWLQGAQELSQNLEEALQDKALAEQRLRDAEAKAEELQQRNRELVALQDQHADELQRREEEALAQVQEARGEARRLKLALDQEADQRDQLAEEVSRLEEQEKAAASTAKSATKRAEAAEREREEMQQQVDLLTNELHELPDPKAYVQAGLTIPAPAELRQLLDDVKRLAARSAQLEEEAVQRAQEAETSEQRKRSLEDHAEAAQTLQRDLVAQKERELADVRSRLQDMELKLRVQETVVEETRRVTMLKHEFVGELPGLRGTTRAATCVGGDDAWRIRAQSFAGHKDSEDPMAKDAFKLRMSLQPSNMAGMEALRFRAGGGLDTLDMELAAMSEEDEESEEDSDFDGQSEVWQGDVASMPRTSMRSTRSTRSRRNRASVMTEDGEAAPRRAALKGRRSARTATAQSSAAAAAQLRRDERSATAQSASSASGRAPGHTAMMELARVKGLFAEEAWRSRQFELQSMRLRKELDLVLAYVDPELARGVMQRLVLRDSMRKSRKQTSRHWQQLKMAGQGAVLKQTLRVRLGRASDGVVTTLRLDPQTTLQRLVDRLRAKFPDTVGECVKVTVEPQSLDDFFGDGGGLELSRTVESLGIADSEHKYLAVQDDECSP